PLPLGLALAAAAACLLLRRAPPRRLLPVAGRAVLVTGCDSGFGQATARHLDSLGFRVFASVLDPRGPGAQELQRSCSSRLTLLRMDLTKPPRGHRAGSSTPGCPVGMRRPRGAAGSVHGEHRCLGFWYPEASCRAGSAASRGSPCVGPRESHGFVFSPHTGDLPFPCLAAYGASKAALSLLMDTFRSELQPWGVKVSLILPGYFKTATCDPDYWNLQKEQLVASLPQELLQAYGEDYVEEINRQFIQFMKVAVEDLSAVVNSITDGLLAANPAVRYYPGQGLGLMYFIHRYLPYFVQDLFLKGLFIKPKLPRALRQEHKDAKK
ncbi:DHI2 dehydrogenase, partial [Alectura lathami]|nr:DHI2 dehydrogenase [Alectura lathami]